MPLTLTPRHSGSVYIVNCAGEIVCGVEERALERVLEHAQHEFSRFVLNLSNVTRLDSMGLGLLVRHYTRVAKRGGAIRLAGAPAFVTNVLDLTRLSATFPNFQTEDEAILSFQNRPSGARSDATRGPRLLVFDPSADLCIFARSVLSRHGFDVRTTCAFGDAKLLLRADQVDFVLVGPGTAQLPAERAARDLSAVAPQASVLQLAPDFMSHDATKAAQILLEVCGITGTSPAPN
jgi:anti-anti-sigma factor